MAHRSRPRSTERGYAAPFILLGVLVCALIAYKAGGALPKIQTAFATRSISVPADIVVPGGKASTAAVWSRTLGYLIVVGPALVFGVLIAGAVRSCPAPTWIVRALGANPQRRQVLAGIAGAPLMLCSCCVAPVFAAVQERSRQPGPSLAVALAAPCLNPAALALTFIVFGLRLGVARLVMALVAVFALPPIVTRAAGVAGMDNVVEPGVQPSAAETVRASAVDRSDLWRVIRFSLDGALRTLPLLVLGIVASMWLVQRVPPFQPGTNTFLAVVVTTLIAIPIALPTFFEIPIALALLGAGGPPAVAAVVLFAGPAINLPSLLTIGRAATWTVAAAAAIGVAVIACTGALALAW